MTILEKRSFTVEERQAALGELRPYLPVPLRQLSDEGLIVLIYWAAEVALTRLHKAKGEAHA